MARTRKWCAVWNGTKHFSFYLFRLHSFQLFAAVFVVLRFSRRQKNTLPTKSNNKRLQIFSFCQKTWHLTTDAVFVTDHSPEVLFNCTLTIFCCCYFVDSIFFVVCMSASFNHVSLTKKKGTKEMKKVYAYLIESHHVNSVYHWHLFSNLFMSCFFPFPSSFSAQM